VYYARFCFDAGSGTLLWADGPDTTQVWGYAVDLRQLPASQALLDDLTGLVAEYDTSRNWDYPPDPGPWREPRCRQFNHDVRQARGRLRAELRSSWQIQDEFRDLHQDPDLDRYLADSAGFRRSGHH
jgi:hypothetical protein